MSAVRRGQATWFGPPERPLFGWVHRPAGDRVRAAVVICPSLGQEATFTYYTLRWLATSLADRGFLTVGFHWDADGDSAGDSEDPDRTGAWRRSVHHALALAREHTDAPLAVVGMRLGALLAVDALQDLPPAGSGAGATAAAGATGVTGAPVESLVLWDPPRSGRSFLREVRVRHRTALGGVESPDGAFDGLGMRLDAASTASLSAVDLHGADPLPCDRALELTRTRRSALPVDARTRAGRPVERRVAPDQDDLLHRNVLPVRTQAAVIGWLERQHPAPAGRLLEAPAPRTTLTLPGGTERLVELGPHRLFGIAFEPDEPRTTTTAVFVPEFHTPHFGLGRIWTELARAWGRDGVPSLRFDLSGCGDSDPRPGLEGHVSGRVEHLDDLADVVGTLSRAGTTGPGGQADVVLAGVCSGAYLAMERADLRPRGLALVNPVLSFIPPEKPASPRRRMLRVVRRPWDLLLGRVASRLAQRQVRLGRVQTPTLDPNFDWGRAFWSCAWEDWFLREGSLGWVPEWLWRLVNTVLLSRQTDQVLAEVTASGTAVQVVVGDPDWPKLVRGCRRPLARLERAGRLRVVYEPGLDHAMMRPGTKQQVARALGDFVYERLGAPPR